jgi:hypothetical protein
MRLAFLLTLAVAVSGCGSIGQNGMPVRDDGLDRERMAVIEQQAQRGGVQVHWVNPPRKRAP